jgi:hypothetical protein
MQKYLASIMYIALAGSFVVTGSQPIYVGEDSKKARLLSY